jgi:outer membrane protein TolC
MMRWALAMTLTVVLAAEAQVPPVLPPQLGLSQALEIALSNSTTLRQAQANFDQSVGRYEQSRSVLLPQVDIGVRQSYLTMNLQGIGIDLPAAPGLIGPFGSMDARITVSQDILNIASLRSSQSYSSRRDSSRFLVENTREALVLNVVGAYLQALRARASRDTLVEQTRLANELNGITGDRLGQGVASQLDANRAKQQVNSLEQQRLEAEQRYVSAKLELANLLHANITDNFEVADNTAYGSGDAPDRAASIQAALSSRPDYRAAVAAVSAAELKVRSVRAVRLPTFQISFDDGFMGNSPVHNNNTYRVQGKLDIPIFTGGRIEGEIHDAEAALREAEAIRDRTRAQIETDVLTAVAGVEWSLRQLAASLENVGLSRQEVQLTRDRFVQGVADNTEVVDSQDRLSRADDANIRARYTLGLARANLARASGSALSTYRK